MALKPVDESRLVGIVPILQGLVISFEKAHPKSLCGICGCLLVVTDPSCPNCRLRMVGPPDDTL